MNPMYEQQMAVARQYGAPMQQETPNLQTAMMNPQAFVKQHFPDIPREIENDPNQILTYLQRTRGIPAALIQRLMGGMGR